MYHAIVPQPGRDWVNRRINDERRWRANIGWVLRTPAGRRRWAARRLNLDESQWLFVLGLSNSGTTLLQNLLGLHPDIRDSRMEGQGMTQALPRAVDYGIERQFTRRLDVFHWTEDDDPSPALRCMFDWAHYFPRGCGYLLIKSPPDILRSRWLQHNFQPCRFMVMTRHPAAVCEGIARRRPNCTIEDAAWHWAVAHDVLLSDRNHLEKTLHVTYEKLCDDTPGVVAEIEQFLELTTPFDPRVIARQFNVHNIENQPAAIRNFNEQSVARLTPEGIDTINRIAGPMMERFGYSPLKSAAKATGVKQ
jgi:hypothetical protein